MLSIAATLTRDFSSAISEVSADASRMRIKLTNLSAENEGRLRAQFAAMASSSYRFSLTRENALTTLTISRAGQS
jgi:hypothetical protein